MNQESEDEVYILSEWGCLYAVLSDYGIDVSDIPGRVGVHIVEDFMSELERVGYLVRGEKNETDCGADMRGKEHG